jgi:hypothetical protein
MQGRSKNQCRIGGKRMKRINFTAVVLLFALALYAQEDTDFYKHEIRVAFGDASITSEIWLQKGIQFNNFSFSYFYRPVTHFWVGANFMNYVGGKTYRYTREYAVDGSYKDYLESKKKYCAIIAPEIRLSFLNRKAIILYSAFSGGIGFENGFDTHRQKYPKKLFPCLNLTLFGLTGNFGKNSNIFLGGELGIGFKGIGSIHGGFRF